MSTIRQYAAGNSFYESLYGTSNNSSSNSFLSGMNMSADTGSTFSLSDYAMIKNGTYGKLTTAYYAKEKAESRASTSDSSTKLTSMAQNSASMSKSAQALMKDSLWQKKTITEKDEKTGEEVTKEDYDWNAITKALKAFVEDYNTTVESAGESDTKDVLRNAVWMTKTTSAYEKTLAKVGITISGSNKLELDEDELKNADIASLKNLFTGHNSFADKVMSKGNTIARAAAGAGGTYTSNGSYSSALSELVSSKVDTKE